MRAARLFLLGLSVLASGCAFITLPEKTLAEGYVLNKLLIPDRAAQSFTSVITASPLTGQDLKTLDGCRLLGDAYRQSSGPRVQLRAKEMVCIDPQGSVWAGQISAYAIGQDGEAGIKSQLIQLPALPGVIGARQGFEVAAGEPLVWMFTRPIELSEQGVFGR